MEGQSWLKLKYGRIPCEYKGREAVATFYVTKANGPAIIGLPTSLELNLVTLNCSVQQSSPQNVSHTAEQATPIKSKDDLVQRYPDCFDGIGKFQGQYHITIDPSVPPVVHAQRRVPLSLRDDIKEELDDMEACGIIMKIKEGKPIAWVNSLVHCRKPNWLTQDMPGPQRPQQSHFQRAPCDSNLTRDPPKAK